MSKVREALGWVDMPRPKGEGFWLRMTGKAGVSDGTGAPHNRVEYTSVDIHHNYCYSAQ